MAKMSILFERRPERWGLRGDPRLWQEMAQEFQTAEFPESETLLVQMISEKFLSLTGVSLEDAAERVLVDRYRVGHGMSDGTVSLNFWRDTALPLLTERYANAQ